MAPRHDQQDPGSPGGRARLTRRTRDVGHYMSYLRRTVNSMSNDPRLIAQSETNRGTRRIRPDSAIPVQSIVPQYVPDIDPDELLKTRDEELASDREWRVRLDQSDLWWERWGGYTRFSSEARRWPSRWDAYNDMIDARAGRVTWEIEQVTWPGVTAIGLATGASYQDLTQAWTSPKDRDGEDVPADGVVHALVGADVPAWALCTAYVEHATGLPWPPPRGQQGLRACERCNSGATMLPRD